MITHPLLQIPSNHTAHSCIMLVKYLAKSPPEGNPSGGVGVAAKTDQVAEKATRKTRNPETIFRVYI